MKAAFYVRIALSLVILGVVLLALSSHSFFVGNPLLVAFAIAFFAKFLILLRTRLDWRELAGLLVSVILLCALGVLAFGYSLNWAVVVCILGCATLGALAMRVIWLAGDERRTAVFTILPCIVFLGAGWTGPAMLAWTGRTQPFVRDLNLFSFDASLHIQVPFLISQFFHRVWPLGIVAAAAYVGLPIVIGLMYAGCLMSDRKNALPCFIALVIMGPVGVLFYNLFPAVGPGYLFGSNFPWHPLTIEQARSIVVRPIAIVGLRNAMPSLHAAWVYVAFWFSRNLSRWEKGLAGFFLVFTLLATLSTGEHYFIDLVVALPFALFILALTMLLVTGNWRRFGTPLVAGLLTTLAWFGLLRFAEDVFWFSPLVPWMACVATAIGTLWAVQRFFGRPAEQVAGELSLREIPVPAGE